MTLEAPLRSAAKRAAGSTGAVTLLHRLRNRRHLTTVTFHRVLAPDDPRSARADPRYTMSDHVFDQTIGALMHWYTPIGLPDLRAAAGGATSLPAYPLLVTIDDGWADTRDYAAPILQRHGCPALVFITSGAVGGRHGFWQERIIGGWRDGSLTPDRLAELWRSAGFAAPAPDMAEEHAVRELIEALGALPAEARAPIVASLPSGPDQAPEMMTAASVAQLAGYGLAIGAHGATHERMTTVGDLDRELREPPAELAALTGQAIGAIDSVSFPYGAYDADTVAAARDAGYRFIFTSDPQLPAVSPAGPPDLLGRIGLRESSITRDGEHGLQPDLLQLWLMRRPRVG